MQKKRDLLLPLARQDNLVVQELDNELLVYYLNNHNAHSVRNI